MNWLPIDTAPKDGTIVDLWVANINGAKFRVTDANFSRGEWRVDGIIIDNLYLTVSIPSHWMPLPEPPK